VKLYNVCQQFSPNSRYGKTLLKYGSQSSHVPDLLILIYLEIPLRNGAEPGVAFRRIGTLNARGIQLWGNLLQ
jgi:hypothetical protein